MRLIDADELLKKVNPNNPKAQFRCVAEKEIINAPTIEKRKTGEWIFDKGGRIHCSACMGIPTTRIMDVVQVLYEIHPVLMNYCPECGAYMKGGQ